MSIVDFVLHQGRAAARRMAVADIAQAILELPDAVGSKIEAVEHAAVLVAMNACAENQSAAARMLGMERKAFTRKLSRAKRKRETATRLANGAGRPRSSRPARRAS